MNSIKQLILTFSLSFVLCNVISSQIAVDTNKWYHDFEIDYYPTLKNCHLNKGLGSLDDNGRAFKESIERIISECTGKEYTLERYSGEYMSQAGMEPKPMKENPSIYLNLFASGVIHSIVVRNLPDKDAVEECLKSSFQSCSANPSLKDGKYVKSSWSFTIH